MAEVPLNHSIASHVTIIDAEGNPVLVSGHEIKPGSTAQDRDYFLHQQQATDDELYISRPHRGRNSGKLIVRLVRRYPNAAGDFGGVMFIALEVDNITQFFNAMKLGPLSSATLVGTDRYIRARSTYGPQGPGQDISDSRIWRELEASPTGLYRQVSVVDDVTRYYAYRALENFPLVVAIGISVDDLQSAIAPQTTYIYTLAFLLTLLIVGTALYLYRQRQWMMQIEAKNLELESRAREIEAKNRTLQDQNAELERFNYTVSHDLKAPLVTIKGFLGLLRKDLSEHDGGAVERDAEQIARAADQMSRLLDELLELSRVGRQMKAPEWCRLRDIVAEAVDALRMQIEDRNIEVVIDDEMPEVYADPGRLREIFQNLIDNAAKFMGEQPRPRIEIGAAREGDSIRCYVRDNGAGIDPDYQQRVFKLFERLDAEVEGTGVGLALVKRIAEVHGGRIELDSEGEGRGSTFTVVLPAGGGAR